MQEVQDRTFEQETVVVDGLRFRNCHLVQCELRYSGGDFVLEGTSIIGCTWSFGGAAQRTLTLMSTLNLSIGEEFRDRKANIWSFSDPMH